MDASRTIGNPFLRPTYYLLPTYDLPTTYLRTHQRTYDCCDYDDDYSYCYYDFLLGQTNNSFLATYYTQATPPEYYLPLSQRARQALRARPRHERTDRFEPQCLA